MSVDVVGCWWICCAFFAVEYVHAKLSVGLLVAAH